MSTGMASMDEVHDAVSIIQDEGYEEIIIMHCITSYPTKSEDANLDMIKSLDLEFPDHIIGYSDHTLGTDIASYSIFYGSKCIEKHFTHDKNLSVSRDHRLSLNSDDFKELIKKIKLIEMSRGSRVRDNFSAESSAVEFARRSIVSKHDIPKGTEITENMIDVKRPGTGILPKYFFKMRLKWFYSLGFCVSILSGLIGATGPIQNPFMLNYGLSKENLIGTKAVNSLFMQFTKLLSYGFFGVLTFEIASYGVIIGIGAIFGIMIAQKHLRSINAVRFKLYMHILMLFCGILLLFKAF